MSQENYFIDGAKVRVIRSPTTRKHIEMMHDWMRSKPMQRTVYALNSKGVWYRLNGAIWASRNEKEMPRQIQMAQLLDAVGKITWNEVKSEIQVNSLF